MAQLVSSKSKAELPVQLEPIAPKSQPDPNPGSQHYTPNDLIAHARDLQTELDKLLKLESVDSHRVTQEAEHLRKVAEAFRDSICNLKNAFSLSKILKGREIPFHFAYRMLEILSKPEIQCLHSLKNELSKTFLIFLEFVVFQAGLEDQRFYKDTVEDMKKQLDKVVSTLPDREIETRFNLRCAQAAVQKLDKGIGKWKEVAKDHGKDVLVGIFKALLTLGAPGPETATSLVGPLTNLSIAIYQNLEEKWYRDVWALRWYCGERRIIVKAQLEAARPLFRNFRKSAASETNYYLSFCISQIFAKIFFNSSSEEALKKAVFEEEDMSLLKLIHFNDEDQFGDNSFWKTRFITLQHLEQIASDLSPTNKDYRLKSIRAILRRWTREKGEVKVYAGSIIPELARANSAEWKQRWENLQDEAKTLDSKLAEIQINHSKLKTEIGEVTTEMNKLQEEFKAAKASKEHATGQKVGDPDVLLDSVQAAQDMLSTIDVEVKKLEEEKEKILEEKNIYQINISDTNDWEKFRVD